MLTPLEIDMNAIPMITWMMQNGMLLDAEYLQQLGREFEEEAQSTNDQIDRLYGKHVNPCSNGSSGQVSRMLVDMGIYPRAQSTDDDHLRQHYEHEVVKHIIHYKHLRTLLDRYVYPLPRWASNDGRVHTQIKHTRTATGRYASDKPNLQNIPSRTEHGRKIRRAFIAPPGKVLLSFDLSQIELRIPAHLANDAVMIDIFNGDGDIHANTGVALFEVATKDNRRVCKIINFRILYGGTAEGLLLEFESEGLEGYTINDTQGYIDGWFGEYYGVKLWIDSVHAAIRRDGFSETMFGRRRLVPEIYSKDSRIRAAGLRQGGNHPVQGTAGDIMKLDLHATYPICRRWDGCLPLMTVHDEELIEAPEEGWEEKAIEIKEAMENVIQLKVPLKVDVEVGYNWGEMEEVEL